MSEEEIANTDLQFEMFKTINNQLCHISSLLTMIYMDMESIRDVKGRFRLVKDMVDKIYGNNEEVKE